MNLREDIEALPSSVESELQRHLTGIMNQSSLFYRIFVRCKSADSAEKKIRIKGYDDTKKMQDLYGARIALYFKDDIAICRKILEQNYEVIDLSEDKEEEAVFAPTRLNYVCKLPKTIKNDIIKDFWVKYPIDDTFEIQIRTIFSEGWHEVEHDLRYKTKFESWWQYCDVESRMLNGIYATLETSERAMNQVFSSIAYKNYRNKEWDAMLRNHLRLHTIDLHLSANITKALNEDTELTKRLFRIERKDVIDSLLKLGTAFPLKMDNLVFLINRLLANPSEALKQMENRVIKDLLDKKIETIKKR